MMYNNIMYNKGDGVVFDNYNDLQYNNNIKYNIIITL